MTDHKNLLQEPVTLTQSIYPQPTSKTGRGQTYSKTPIVLPELPIEQEVTPIPWRELLGATGLAALLASGVDWLIGIWAGSVDGSLELAMVGALTLIVFIAGLTWLFYRYITDLLRRKQVPYAQVILWGSILCILPVSQGLRWLLMPELIAHDMPVMSRGILYVIVSVGVWVGVAASIAGVLLRARMSERRRHYAVVWIIALPYFVAVPLGIISFIHAMNLLSQA